ncbi:hypothetical protein M089_4396 [Bacteroides ovatus str. 3725 D9 iii]|nr:hypothetical protein M082_1424 [Bacteroides fragilis str. 3725 D9 ii]KDS24522.1 hypothetical protein M088_4862 [Bacteroides ovatus str. 3725 D1 iv]KDS25488.1 hypothetical protein M089_4396 [Bacteroides ovatus str. 3725 D9 iii]
MSSDWSYTNVLISIGLSSSTGTKAFIYIGYRYENMVYTFDFLS